MQKNIFIVFEILKLKNLQSDCPRLFAFDHANLKLHDQFVALIDMRLHSQNQLYTSISFRDIKVLNAS